LKRGINVKRSTVGKYCGKAQPRCKGDHRLPKRGTDHDMRQVIGQSDDSDRGWNAGAEQHDKILRRLSARTLK
jgi:hypothetical protein